jgi:hypothetical protein
MLHVNFPWEGCSTVSEVDLIFHRCVKERWTSASQLQLQIQSSSLVFFFFFSWILHLFLTLRRKRNISMVTRPEACSLFLATAFLSFVLGRAAAFHFLNTYTTLISVLVQTCHALRPAIFGHVLSSEYATYAPCHVYSSMQIHIWYLARPQPAKDEANSVG